MTSRLNGFCFLDAVLGEGEEAEVGVNADEVAAVLFGDDSRYATAAKGVKHRVAFLRG